MLKHWAIVAHPSGMRNESEVVPTPGKSEIRRSKSERNPKAELKKMPKIRTDPTPRLSPELCHPVCWKRPPLPSPLLPRRRGGKTEKTEKTAPLEFRPS